MIGLLDKIGRDTAGALRFAKVPPRKELAREHKRGRAFSGHGRRRRTQFAGPDSGYWWIVSNDKRPMSREECVT